MQVMLAVKNLSKYVFLTFLWGARGHSVAQNSTNIHNTSLDGWMGGGEVNDFTFSALFRTNIDHSAADECYRSRDNRQVMSDHG